MTNLEYEFTEKYVAMLARKWRAGERLSRFQFYAVPFLCHRGSLPGFLRLWREDKSAFPFSAPYFSLGDKEIVHHASGAT